MTKQSTMTDKKTQSSGEMDLLSNCCKADFNPWGFEKEEGVWQERCNKCSKLCEVDYQPVPTEGDSETDYTIKPTQEHTDLLFDIIDKSISQNWFACKNECCAKKGRSVEISAFKIAKYVEKELAKAREEVAEEILQMLEEKPGESWSRKFNQMLVGSIKLRYIKKGK